MTSHVMDSTCAFTTVLKESAPKIKARFTNVSANNCVLPCANTRKSTIVSTYIGKTRLHFWRAFLQNSRQSTVVETPTDAANIL